jgi:type IV pilus assembly protein PilY1
MPKPARYMYGLAPFNSTASDYDSRTVTSTSPVKYISPIPADDECSANYIFLLTDGEPYGTSSTRADVKGNTAGITGTSCSSKSQSSDYTGANWDCMKALATYNNSTSTSTGSPKKKIYTSTMILGPLASAKTNMEAVASNGGGLPYTATSTAALVNGLLNTVEEAIKVSGTIAAAGVAVNQLNRLSHLDQLYYAVFEPRPNQYRWDGNLKRYKLSGNGSAILDITDTSAIADDGLFKPTSKSFWGTIEDGQSATVGGAANKLPSPNDRKMFTYMGALNSTNQALTPIDLTSSDFNSAAKTATGISDDSTYMNLMNWYKGYEIETLYDGAVTPTTERKTMGAALHSQPVLINYGYTGDLSTAANANNQDNYLFFSTLEGTLHAIEAKTGIEKFSFIPSEKLATLKSQYDNAPSALPQFGMDLTWTVLRKDSDNSGKIGAGDKIYLYGGMRMGGSNYYAIDATNLTAPKLLFAIDGGVGGADKYTNMGQTWSQPVIANVKVNGLNTAVIIFGGGYDPRHETANEIFTGKDKGNQLYIVNAITGELLWFASGNSTDNADKYVEDMKFSVPSSPKPVDVNGDGAIDAIYFGDLGGQVFRVDLDNKATSGTSIAKRVRLLAKLGQTESATPANQRRFYEPPAVATFKDSAGNKFATVAIGSGYRSRP